MHQVMSDRTSLCVCDRDRLRVKARVRVRVSYVSRIEVRLRSQSPILLAYAMESIEKRSTLVNHLAHTGTDTDTQT